MAIETISGRKEASPSVYVLTIPDRADVERMTRVMAALGSPGGGKPVYAIGDDEWILARSIQKQLRAARDTDEDLADWFRRQPGVTDVKVMRGRAAMEHMAQAMPAWAPAERHATGTRAASRFRPSWNLAMVGAPEAWDMMGGLDQPNPPWAARDLRLGLLDTGVVAHPAIPFWRGPDSGGFVHVHEGANLFDPKEHSSEPIDPLAGYGTPGHGTRILSVVCGYERGRFAGVAPRANVVPYRVTNFVVINTLLNTETGLAEGIVKANIDKGCQVLNISLGDPCIADRTVGEAIDRAYEDGVIVVAAAGNYTSEVTYPGRHRRTITAGGVSEDRRPWRGGSFGRRVDISAPANEVYRATYDHGQDPPASYSPEDGDGTSYATAHVSGAALLWTAFHGRRLEQMYGMTWRRVEAFRHCLKASARPGLDWDAGRYGAGILHIPDLLRQELPPPERLVYTDDLAADDLA